MQKGLTATPSFAVSPHSVGSASMTFWFSPDRLLVLRHRHRRWNRHRLIRHRCQKCRSHRPVQCPKPRAGCAACTTSSCRRWSCRTSPSITSPTKEGKEYRLQQFVSLVDLNKTAKENITFMASQGLVISMRTYRNYMSNLHLVMPR